MKHTALRTLIPAAVVLLPSFAMAHPGHFALDPMAGPPHAGHGIELGSVLATAALSIAMFATAGWLKARRR